MARITQIRCGLWGRMGGLLAGDSSPPDMTPGPGATVYLRNSLLDHVFGGSAMAQPTTVYASLHTGPPGETGDNEVTGGSYVRQAVTFAASGAGLKTNSDAVEWADVPESNLTHIGLWDAESSGNLLYGDVLDDVAEVTGGSTVRAEEGNLTIMVE